MNLTVVHLIFSIPIYFKQQQTFVSFINIFTRRIWPHSYILCQFYALLTRCKHAYYGNSMALLMVLPVQCFEFEMSPKWCSVCGGARLRNSKWAKPNIHTCIHPPALQINWIISIAFECIALRRRFWLYTKSVNLYADVCVCVCAWVSVFCVRTEDTTLHLTFLIVVLFV